MHLNKDLDNLVMVARIGNLQQLLR
uniref:Uncharacterized protein n=1 Tax=Arundo donax TaxID=35708 RepID=A0A0A9AMM0_ARUDO